MKLYETFGPDRTFLYMMMSLLCCEAVLSFEKAATGGEAADIASDEAFSAAI